MTLYHSIRRWRNNTERNRVLDRLVDLRGQLHEEVLAREAQGSFLLATWNIRDFDSNKFGHGKRMRESFHYIAEIISAFDLVAVQEVNRDLSGLRRVMELLGRGWDFIVTDTTEGSGGNEERMAFVFNTHKVRFRNIAGEIVLPQGQKVVARKKIKDDKDPDKKTIEEREIQFARTPFMVAFQAGWFKFNLCSVHIYFGASSGLALERRIKEIRRLAKFFARRQNKGGEDYILLGDFNIVNPEHQTMEALEAEGFSIAENLKKETSNLKGDKHYDQIALGVRDKRLEIGASGVFDYRGSVFRDRDFDAYKDAMPAGKRDFHYRGRKKGEPRTPAEQRAYYRDEWRTWQMSDHLPMWVELKVDFTEDYLKSLKTGAVPLTN